MTTQEQPQNPQNPPKGRHAGPVKVNASTVDYQPRHAKPGPHQPRKVIWWKRLGK